MGSGRMLDPDISWQQNSGENGDISEEKQVP
jgi:hypothetical protein